MKARFGAVLSCDRIPRGYHKIVLDSNLLRLFLACALYSEPNYDIVYRTRLAFSLCVLRQQRPQAREPAT